MLAQRVQHDPTLQGLVETPLMLSVMALAYRGRSVEDLQTLETTVARRKHVFESYVQWMFERRRVDHPYSPQQTIQWLAWLAQQMSVHGQTVFLIEKLQPDWLPVRSRRRMRIVGRLVGELGGGLVLGLGGWLDGWLGGGLVGGLAGGLVGGLAGMRDSIEPVGLLKWSWGEVASGLVGELRRALVWGLRGVLVRGLVFALVGGLVSGLRGALHGELFGELVEGLVVGMAVGLALGLSAELVGGLGVGLLRGLSNVELQARMVPNQGIWQSARNALVVCLVSGLVGGLVGGLVRLVVGLVGGLLDVLPNVLPGGLLYGLMAAVTLGLHFGGAAVILHFALRYFLWRDGYLPWNLVQFLDYAAERIFLRKVGGGYVFIHGLLQDYFASLYQGQ